MKKTTRGNENGFTLIELMIVIAIIGILAAIAIPNYISFRDKGFCTAAESDAKSLIGGLSDYFSIPSNQSFNGVTNATSVTFPASSNIFLSGNNKGTITPIVATTQFTVSVTDQSGRCPTTYQSSDSRWSVSTPGVFTISFF